MERSLFNKLLKKNVVQIFKASAKFDTNSFIFFFTQGLIKVNIFMIMIWFNCLDIYYFFYL